MAKSPHSSIQKKAVSLPGLVQKKTLWPPHEYWVKQIKSYIQGHLDFPLKVTEQPEQENTIPHAHEFVELVVILKGRGRHLTAFDSQKLSRGDILIIPTGMEHQYQDVEDLSLINILFDPDRLPFRRLDLCTIPGYNLLLHLAKHNPDQNLPFPSLHLDEQTMTLLESQLTLLLSEFKECLPGFRTRTLGLFLYLIGKLAPLYMDIPQSKGSLHQQAINKVIAFLEGNYDRNVPLAELTRLASMSKSALMREFKRLTGTSPGQFLISLRLDHASRLIISQRESLSRVGFRVGFSSISYFSRCFAHRFGLSPRQYQKKICGLP